jgi:GDP-L-fucose synthase
LDANQDQIILWGTGNATREFLYAEDCADAILSASEKYDQSDPINIGTGREITIHELIMLICELANFKGEILWDTTQPDGQPRRCLDVSKAEKKFGFRAKVGLKEGLQRTIDFYKDYRRARLG